ncbi:hypothetical protein ABVT39_017979 [Epinephelus coioides]
MENDFNPPLLSYEIPERQVPGGDDVVDPHQATYAVVKKPKKEKGGKNLDDPHDATYSLLEWKQKEPTAGRKKEARTKPGENVVYSSINFTAEPTAGRKKEARTKPGENVVYSSINFTAGQSNLIGSPQPIIALAGDDVILPCHLDPPTSASSRTVEWTRPGLDPEYVHVHQDGRLVHQSQNPLYHYRTVLFVDQPIYGNISLKPFRVKISDVGLYKCFLPSLRKEAFIQLNVGKSDFVSFGRYGDKCQCDLYTVSSRVTVEKRHSNSFTCRVQQRKEKV